ncbi:hypothetical protein FAI40_10095 [Acetobacteraceae bacterium]|nr:hypothetical protein FAI40_10095 [Acetobacteraceae bacterium]
MSFQKKVNYNWPEGYPGGIASANPRRTVVAPQGGWRAGTNGVTIASFAWADPTDDSGQTLTNKAPSAVIPDGFILREQQGLTTQYLQDATMSIPEGFGVVMVDGGDYFALSSTDATRGQAIFANTADGSIQTAAKGSTVSGAVDTGWIVTRGAPTGQVLIMTGPLESMLSLSAASPTSSPSK